MPNPPSFGRRAIAIAAGGIVAGGALAGGRWMLTRHAGNLYQVRGERTLMQTSVAITALADTKEQAHRAIDAAFTRMRAAAATLNRFDPASAVGRLNRIGMLEAPPPDLLAVLRHARGLSEASEGAFDVTVQPVLDYYLSLPRPVVMDPAIRRAVAAREVLVGYRNLAFDPHRVALTRAGAGITLDGIAKGYVVDQGIAVLRAHGIAEALIDAGGDLRAIARPDGKRFWNVGIVDPLNTKRVAAVVRINNAAVATSGNYEVYFSADKRLFHIINPHSGYSPDRYASVTVVASEAVESDGGGVAAFSTPLGRMRELFGARNDEWLVFSWDGTQRFRSRGLPLVAGEAKVL